MSKITDADIESYEKGENDNLLLHQTVAGAIMDEIGRQYANQRMRDIKETKTQCVLNGYLYNSYKIGEAAINAIKEFEERNK